MATLEELLNGSTPYDDIDEVILVDPVQRKLLVPRDEMILGVVGDKRSECKYFMLPKVVGNGVDVSECTLRVIYTNANGDKDYFRATQCVSDDASFVFCWELDPKVTAHAGDVAFSVSASLSLNGVVQKEWNTTEATGKVLPGPGGATHEDASPTPDILGRIEQLEEAVQALTPEYVTEAQYAALQAAGNVDPDVSYFIYG